MSTATTTPAAVKSVDPSAQEKATKSQNAKRAVGRLEHAFVGGKDNAFPVASRNLLVQITKTFQPDARANMGKESSYFKIEGEVIKALREKKQAILDKILDQISGDFDAAIDAYDPATSVNLSEDGKPPENVQLSTIAADFLGIRPNTTDRNRTMALACRRASK